MARSKDADWKDTSRLHDSEQTIMAFHYLVGEISAISDAIGAEKLRGYVAKAIEYGEKNGKE